MRRERGEGQSVPTLGRVKAPDGSRAGLKAGAKPQGGSVLVGSGRFWSVLVGSGRVASGGFNGVVRFQDAFPGCRRVGEGCSCLPVRRGHKVLSTFADVGMKSGEWLPREFRPFGRPVVNGLYSEEVPRATDRLFLPTIDGVGSKPEEPPGARSHRVRAGVHRTEVAGTKSATGPAVFFGPWQKSARRGRDAPAGGIS